MCRCKACDSMLSDYELTLKRKVYTEAGYKEVYEDLCGKCRGGVYDQYDDSIDDYDNDNMEEV